MAKKKTEEVEVDSTIEEVVDAVEQQEVEVDKLDELVNVLCETEGDIGTVILTSVEEPEVVVPKVAVKCECGGIAITVRNRTGAIKVCRDCGLVK